MQQTFLRAISRLFSTSVRSSHVFFSIVLLLAWGLIGCAGMSGPSSSTSPGTQPGVPSNPQSTMEALYTATVGCAPELCPGKDGVFAFKFDSSTGQMTDVPGSPFHTGSFVHAVAVHPSGNLLFVGEHSETAGRDPIVDVGTNDIIAMTIDKQTGALEQAGHHCALTRITQ